MDGNGDGEHNGRNRPRFHLLFPRGDRPPADQLNAGLVAWMEFLLNRGLEDAQFNIFMDVLQEPEQQNNADNNEHHENHDDNDDIDNEQDRDDNDGIDNEQDRDNNDDIDHEQDRDDNDDIDHEQDRDDNDGIDNNDNNDDIHNDNVDDNVDNTDNHSVDHADSDNVSAEEAGTSAGVEIRVGANQGVEEDDPLPGVSRRRSRDEDGPDVEERNSKRFRWWDEFAESSTDSDSDSTDCDDKTTDCNTGNSPVKHAGAGAEVAEEDPLPGPSRKRSRKSNNVEDERSVKKSRQCYEFADSNSDTVTVRTGHTLAHSSCSIDQAEGVGAADDTDGEDNQQVEKENPRPRGSRKRSREDDDEEDRKRFKR